MILCLPAYLQWVLLDLAVVGMEQDFQVAPQLARPLQRGEPLFGAFLVALYFFFECSD